MLRGIQELLCNVADGTMLGTTDEMLIPWAVDTIRHTLMMHSALQASPWVAQKAMWQWAPNPSKGHVMQVP